MGRHFSGLDYIIRHKWYVFLMCLKLKVPLKQAIFHDWTKLLPHEWFPYVNFFYEFNGGRRDIGAVKYEEWFRKTKKRFMKSWERHVHFHKHHWQAWLDKDDNPSEMSENYVREMAADWVATGMTLNVGKIGVHQWYKENKDKIILHPNTRKRVEELLNQFKDAEA